MEIVATSTTSAHHHVKETAILADKIILKYKVMKFWKDLEVCLNSMQLIRERRFLQRQLLFKMKYPMNLFQTFNWNLIIKIVLILRLKIFNQHLDEE